MRSRSVLLLLVVVVGFGMVAFVARGQEGPGVYLPWMLRGVKWPVDTATPTTTWTPTLTATATPTTTPAANVRIVAIDGEDEYVIVRNLGTGAQTMSGWWLRSSDGQSCQPLASQMFSFPGGYVLAAGASVRVTSGPNAVHNPPAVLRWTTSSMWANGGDRGDLHDQTGRLRSSYAYGSCR